MTSLKSLKKKQNKNPTHSNQNHVKSDAAVSLQTECEVKIETFYVDLTKKSD